VEITVYKGGVNGRARVYNYNKLCYKRVLFFRIPTIYSKQFSIFTCSQQNKLLVVSGLKSRLEDHTQKNIFFCSYSERKLFPK
jgi:hypothetical protein